MKLGICPYGLAEAEYPAIGRAAERLGFESLWLPDHLALPVRFRSRYPYSPDGESGLTHDVPFVDPWIALSFVAAQTSRIKLGTNIYLLPLRHPIVTAKTVGSVDALSGGRALLGVGMGWLAEEFTAVAESFDDRTQRACEAIEIIRRLWSDDAVEHHGAHYELEAVGMFPKPARGSVPIIIGGHSNAALRRAARLGDGWIGSPALPEKLESHLREMLPRIDACLDAAGRSRQDFEITGGVMGLPTAEQVGVAEAMGLDRLIVGPWLLNPGASLAEAVRTLEDLATVTDRVT